LVFVFLAKVVHVKASAILESNGDPYEGHEVVEILEMETQDA
jgi:hypothetical protein